MSEREKERERERVLKGDKWWDSRMNLVFWYFPPFFFYSYLLLKLSTRHFDDKNNWIYSWSLSLFLSSLLLWDILSITSSLSICLSPFFPFLLNFFFLGNKRDFHKVRREWSTRYNWFRINKYKKMYQHFLYSKLIWHLFSFINWRLWRESSIVVWQ